MGTATINGLNTIDLEGRALIGFDVAATICKARLSIPELPLTQFDLGAIDAGIEFLESVEKGRKQLEDMTKYCSTMEDLRNYRDFSKATGERNPDLYRDIQILQSIKTCQPVLPTESSEVEEAFRKLAYDSSKLLFVLEPVCTCH